MARIIDLPTFKDDRGNLTVIEKILPFEVKRVYYIYNAKGKRGGHRHKETTQALIAVSGSCTIYCNDNIQEITFNLDNPNKCLILESKDWHTMDDFSSDCVLLVLSSHLYDVNDYIDDEY